MESVNEIKEALSARSRTATLEELRNEGRRRVRLVRAEHIAAMIAEAVHAAIDQSGLVAPDEVDKLVAKSREEFKVVLQQREAELQRAHDNEALLAARDQELAQLQQRLGEVSGALAKTKAMCSEVQAACEQAKAEAAAARAAAAATPPPPPAPAGVPAELLLSLVQEMATLKAGLMQQAAHPATPAAPAVPDFAAAIEKMTGSLNDRLETLGRKMGISAAVGGDGPVDFGGLFKDTGKSLESNIENIEVKQKAAGGIAANLARLKKLKGGD